jgi:F0F1-type ATP synthase epsilon subunit
VELQIVGVDQKEQFSVQWVELQTKIGNLIIQPEHAPMIVELQPSSQVRFCLDNTKQKTVDIAAGFAHITRSDVTILISNNL